MLTALYDGHCLICQSSVATLRALDWRQRIEFVDLHDSALNPNLRLDNLMGELHVLDEKGALHSGFAAMRRLLRELPLMLPLSLLLHIPGADAIGQPAYRFVARRRYRLNKLLGWYPPACINQTCAKSGAGGSE